MTVPRGTEELLSALTALVQAENQRQNLIAASTIAQFEQRHLEDSLQLVPLCAPGALLDIGSGGGFPGLVLACARADPIVLAEPRRRRAAFLHDAATALGLANVSVFTGKVERLAAAPFATITARAVAPLAKLFEMSCHVADETTRWVLPKGRTAAEEVAEARATWHGEMMLIPSLTDRGASIVVARGVRRKRQA